jgi:hypothetical protein
VYRLVCNNTVDAGARGGQLCVSRRWVLLPVASPEPALPAPLTPSPPHPTNPPPSAAALPTHPPDIYNIQQRKLRLDAAVLEGVTISTEAEGGRGRGRGRGGRGRGGVSAADARHMGAILAALLGDEDEDGEGSGPDEGDPSGGGGGGASMAVSMG